MTSVSPLWALCMVFNSKVGPITGQQVENNFINNTLII